MKHMIAISGIDGCGKTTLCKKILDMFQQKNISAKVIQPYHYEIPRNKIMREAISYIKQNVENGISMKQVNMIQEAMGFCYIVDAECKKQETDILIFDRYIETLYVRHKDDMLLDQLLCMVPKPDVYCIVGTPPEECMNRIMLRGNVNSEVENLFELQKTYRYYLDNCKRFGCMLKSAEEIEEICRSIIKL